MTTTLALAALVLLVGVVWRRAHREGLYADAGVAQPLDDAGLAQPPADAMAPVAQPLLPQPTCPGDMALIPAGSFLMGSPVNQGEPNELPQRRVEIQQPFCMDRTEVSVASYRACVLSGHCTGPNTYAAGLPANHPDGIEVFCNWDRPGAEAHPVNCVDWNQAHTFCAWNGHPHGARRLPREVEWEYAAHGTGTPGRPYPWQGDVIDGAHVNLCGDECVAYAEQHGFHGMVQIAGWHDEFPTTAPVDSYAAGATPEGLRNMSGNVWEWVGDVYENGAYAPQDPAGAFRQPSQSDELHVYRGGGGSVVTTTRARAAYRDWRPASLRSVDLGFRCARAVLEGSGNP